MPVDYANITPVGETTPLWLQQVPPGQPSPTLPAATPPVAGVPSPTARATQDASSSPTPDATRPSVLERQSVEEYTVQRGDSLNQIGQRYGVSALEIATANGMQLADTLPIGRVLRIPVPNLNNFGPSLKLLPDSDFVLGPTSVGFNLDAFVNAYDGYLAHYTENIAGSYLDGSSQSRRLKGSEIVQLVAEHYSLSPRLLLALIEHQSGWVRQRSPGSNSLAYPLGDVEPGRDGLYLQLTWAARQLNYGYYSWRVASIVSWSFGDGSIRLIAPGLNAATVGLQSYFARQNLAPAEWERAVSAKGFAATYGALFGNPFQYAFEPLVPPDLVQPALQLPFQPDEAWYFTGGPHAAWDLGSAWAALDFAPPGKPQGCVLNDAWVTAAAAGLVVRAHDGSVVVDLDEDGYEQTGWDLFYLHIDSQDRVEVGTRLKAGDPIGHPSCEGGISNGTHVHFARKYNGEWIPADGAVPFVLDGWISGGLASEYDGTLTKGVITLVACDCNSEANQISRP